MLLSVVICRLIIGVMMRAIAEVPFVFLHRVIDALINGGVWFEN